MVRFLHRVWLPLSFATQVDQIQLLFLSRTSHDMCVVVRKDSILLFDEAHNLVRQRLPELLRLSPIVHGLKQRHAGVCVLRLHVV